MHRLSFLIFAAMFVCSHFCVALPSSSKPCACPHDRDNYDVIAYRIDLKIDPNKKSIAGTVGIELVLTQKDVHCLVFDLVDEMCVTKVRLVRDTLGAKSSLSGRPANFEHSGDQLHCKLPEASDAPQRFVVAIEYKGSPQSHDKMSGFHWGIDPDHNPWISTSSQIIGAHHWWPCKASFFQPADRCDLIWLNLTVPKDLVCFSNGKLSGTEASGGRWKLWRWHYDYPISTYGVTVNIGNYEQSKSELKLPGLESPVELHTCVLPHMAEAAAVQFAQIPELLEIYSKCFGPYPFPKAKVGVAHTCFASMEHSSAIAYGWTFPSWLAKHDKPDPAQRLNRYYDYVLVHQFAHEWWGNNVAASTWKDVWLHEGFATYAESLYLEATRGREITDEYFQGLLMSIRGDSTLMPKSYENFREAYSRATYNRGSWVLNTLRHFVDDDAAWFKTLQEFQSRHRHGVASTEDFRKVLEDVTKRPWKEFFDQWVYGSGYPKLSGEITATEEGLSIKIENEGTTDTGFDLPLDLRWREDCSEVRRRVWLSPGTNKIVIDTGSEAEGLQLVGMNRILGEHRVRIR
ncbi:MAG: aminopeptidase N [Planctomycetota bacterium]|jgi:aminopeptidase N